MNTALFRMLGILVLVAAMGGVANAQTGTLSADDGTGGPGDTVSVFVRLANSEPAEGFSFGLSHDGSQVSAVSVGVGPALDAAQGGQDPDVFFAMEAAAGGAGVTVGCLMDLNDTFETLPAGDDHRIVEVQYTIAATASTAISTLDFTETLGSPPVEILLALNGQEVIPALVSGSLDVQATPFQRGDCNQDGNVNLIDAVICLRRFHGLEPPTTCQDADDIDGSGSVGMNDSVFLMAYLFNGGSPPPAPFGMCDLDCPGEHPDLQRIRGLPLMKPAP